MFEDFAIKTSHCYVITNEREKARADLLGGPLEFAYFCVMRDMLCGSC